MTSSPTRCSNTCDRDRDKDVNDCFQFGDDVTDIADSAGEAGDGDRESGEEGEGHRCSSRSNCASDGGGGGERERNKVGGQPRRIVGGVEGGDGKRGEEGVHVARFEEL